MQGRPTGGIAASAFKNTILNIDTSRPITANSEDGAGDTLTRITDIESFSYNYGEVRCLQMAWLGAPHRASPPPPSSVRHGAPQVPVEAHHGWRVSVVRQRPRLLWLNKRLLGARERR